MLPPLDKRLLQTRRGSINLESWGGRQPRRAAEPAATAPLFKDPAAFFRDLFAMDSQAQAIAILQKARDALAARLTQRVIESQQEIEDDADGGTYFSEIEAIYDQLGGRLAHLNAML